MNIFTSTLTQDTTTVTEMVARLPPKGPMLNATSNSIGTGSLSTKIGPSPVPTSNVIVLPTATSIRTGYPHFNITTKPIKSSTRPILPIGTGNHSTIPTIAPAMNRTFPHPTPLASASIHPTTNTTLPAATTPLPTPPAPPTLDDCPSINNTTITVDDQQLRIQCYRHYEGSSYLGLQESTFLACIEMCTDANLDNDAICSGVTWTPYVDTEGAVKCDLKGYVGSILSEQSLLHSFRAMCTAKVYDSWAF